MSHCRSCPKFAPLLRIAGVLLDDARPSAILIDEFDPGSFGITLDDIERRVTPPGVFRVSIGIYYVIFLANRGNTARSCGQL